jgi:hypothetical protein
LPFVSIAKTKTAMWSNSGDEDNESDEAIRLYQPIIYGRKALQDDVTCSFVGGSPSPLYDEMHCASCRGPMPMLLQLFLPKQLREGAATRLVDRTLQVFSCNKASCFYALFSSGSKLVEGGGVVVCRRLAVASSIEETEQAVTIPILPPSSWTEKEELHDSNIWSVNATYDGVDSLEAKFAAMETSKPSTPSKAETSHNKKKEEKYPIRNSFPCYLLHVVQEPSAFRRAGTDEDDVGINSGKNDDDKIRQMLARYIAEEEDEDILSALRVDASGRAGSGGGGTEKDERISAADRALFTFSDRIKRSPRQVVRYAYNGAPLWSM